MGDYTIEDAKRDLLALDFCPCTDYHNEAVKGEQ